MHSWFTQSQPGCFFEASSYVPVLFEFILFFYKGFSITHMHHARKTANIIKQAALSHKARTSNSTKRVFNNHMQLLICYEKLFYFKRQIQLLHYSYAHKNCYDKLNKYI